MLIGSAASVPTLAECSATRICRTCPASRWSYHCAGSGRGHARRAAEAQSAKGRRAQLHSACGADAAVCRQSRRCWATRCGRWLGQPLLRWATFARLSAKALADAKPMPRESGRHRRQPVMRRGLLAEGKKAEAWRCTSRWWAKSSQARPLAATRGMFLRRQEGLERSANQQWGRRSTGADPLLFFWRRCHRDCYRARWRLLLWRCCSGSSMSWRPDAATN